MAARIAFDDADEAARFKAKFRIEVMMLRINARAALDKMIRQTRELIEFGLVSLDDALAELDVSAEMWEQLCAGFDESKAFYQFQVSEREARDRRRRADELAAATQATVKGYGEGEPL